MSTKLFFTSRGSTITHATRQTLTAAEAMQWGRRALGANKRGVLFIHWPLTGKNKTVRITKKGLL